jgi:hypothetical protein
VLPGVFVWMALWTLVAAQLFRRPGRADAALSNLRALVVTAGAALLAAALVRAGHAPDPDHWLEAAPATAGITPHFGPAPGPCEAGREAIVVPLREVWEPLGHLPDRRCPLAARTLKLVPQSPEEKEMDTFWAGPGGWLDVAARRMVTMLRDEEQHAWVIHAEWWTPRSGEYNRDWRDLEDAASTASAPRGWIAGLVAGLLVAALAWLQRRRVEGRRAMAALDLLAIASVALTAAPLLAAAMVGLVV